MDFQIRTLMIKLSPHGGDDDDDDGCHGNSGIDSPHCCTSCASSAPPRNFEDPSACEAPTNGGDPEGDNYENPAGAAHDEGFMGLILLQQKLRETLSQAG